MEQQIDVVQTTGHVETGIVSLAQELKPPGGRRSWRDETRFRLQQALGETGERLGEGLLGESEEDKYLEFLQREYGSEHLLLHSQVYHQQLLQLQTEKLLLI